MDEVSLALAVLGIAAALAMFLTLPINDVMLSPVSWIRAKRLFLSKLSDAERRCWDRHCRLVVTASSGRRYTVTPYEAFNIRSGKQAYCLRVMGRAPAYDKLLAQRLLLECDEQTFLAVANRREIL